MLMIVWFVPLSPCCCFDGLFMFSLFVLFVSFQQKPPKGQTPNKVRTANNNIVTMSVKSNLCTLQGPMNIDLIKKKLVVRRLM